MKNEVKIYSVTFNQYTNYNNDTVYSDLYNIYCLIPFGGLLIREDEFDYYKTFGNGFNSLKYVGSLVENIKSKKI